ncbi:MAG: hypothetical protein HYU99_10530 [Deltaproteobacteria bacterium]|nr:hypothetical protein [Deltaproteobacteria bacterium]
MTPDLLAQIFAKNLGEGKSSGEIASEIFTHLPESKQTPQTYGELVQFTETTLTQLVGDKIQSTGTASAQEVQNPTHEEIEKKLEDLAIRYDVPKKALVALIATESDFRQFDENGKPLSPGTSSAIGLGQILKPTAKLYGADYGKLGSDWEYNLEVAVQIYAAGYHHPWNSSITDLALRAARAYGMYHDGFKAVYKTNPDYIDTVWEKRYKSRY